MERFSCGGEKQQRNGRMAPFEVRLSHARHVPGISPSRLPKPTAKPGKQRSPHLRCQQRVEERRLLYNQLAAGNLGCLASLTKLNVLWSQERTSTKCWPRPQTTIRSRSIPFPGCLKGSTACRLERPQSNPVRQPVPRACCARDPVVLERQQLADGQKVIGFPQREVPYIFIQVNDSDGICISGASATSFHDAHR